MKEAGRFSASQKQLRWAADLNSSFFLWIWAYEHWQSVTHWLQNSRFSFLSFLASDPSLRKTHTSNQHNRVTGVLRFTRNISEKGNAHKKKKNVSWLHSFRSSTLTFKTFMLKQEAADYCFTLKCPSWSVCDTYDEYSNKLGLPTASPSSDSCWGPNLSTSHKNGFTQPWVFLHQQFGCFLSRFQTERHPFWMRSQNQTVFATADSRTQGCLKQIWCSLSLPSKATYASLVCHSREGGAHVGIDFSSLH